MIIILTFNLTYHLKLIPLDFNEVVLLEQNFVVDDSIKINQFIEKTSKELDGSIEIKKFVRYKVGEGI